MKLFDHHDSQARRPRPWRRHAILFAIAVAVLALAWMGFNAVLTLVTLD